MTGRRRAAVLPRAPPHCAACGASEVPSVCRDGVEVTSRKDAEVTSRAAAPAALHQAPPPPPVLQQQLLLLLLMYAVEDCTRWTDEINSVPILETAWCFETEVSFIH